MDAAGHRVLISDSAPFPITKFAKGVKKTFRTPRPRYEPVEWTQAIARIAREEGVDLIVPIHEGTEILANTVKRYPDLFPDGSKLLFSDFDLEARLENKYEFQAALKTRGIPRGLFTVECNPRATSGILVFDPETRVDRAFFGVNDEVIMPAPGASKMLGPGMLMYGWRKSARKDNTFRGFLRDYSRTDGVIFDRRDPRPSLALPLAMGNILAEAARYRVNIPEAFMHDHEWDGGLPADVNRGPCDQLSRWARQNLVIRATLSPGLVKMPPWPAPSIWANSAVGIRRAVASQRAGGKNRSCSNARTSVGTPIARRCSGVGSPAVIHCCDAVSCPLNPSGPAHPLS